MTRHDVLLRFISRSFLFFILTFLDCLEIYQHSRICWFNSKRNTLLWVTVWRKEGIKRIMEWMNNGWILWQITNWNFFEAVANWSIWDFWLIILITFGRHLVYLITADLLMNIQAQMNHCRSCGSWVLLLQIVSKWKSFIKQHLSQELSYIKLIFKMYVPYTGI